MSFHQFRQAAEAAKALAFRFHEAVGVKRNGRCWDLAVSDRISAELQAQVLAEMNGVADDEYADDASMDEYDDESPDGYESLVDQEVAELRAELQDDEDDYARSYEEGWMYSDD